ncbi:MAG: ArdC-like ssDNA-binding domain-containing protein [Brucella intermedia]
MLIIWSFPNNRASSSTSASARRAHVYSRVTAEIIAAIKQGAGEWRAPWFHDGTSVSRPTNGSSGKRYRDGDEAGAGENANPHVPGDPVSRATDWPVLSLIRRMVMGESMK